jgi:hypothetical protein
LWERKRRKLDTGYRIPIPDDMKEAGCKMHEIIMDYSNPIDAEVNCFNERNAGWIHAGPDCELDWHFERRSQEIGLNHFQKNWERQIQLFWEE